MEVIKYDIKKEILILLENGKKRKYAATIVYSESGYDFLWCRKYLFNFIRPEDQHKLESLNMHV